MHHHISEYRYWIVDSEVCPYVWICCEIYAVFDMTKRIPGRGCVALWLPEIIILANGSFQGDPTRLMGLYNPRTGSRLASALVCVAHFSMRAVSLFSKKYGWNGSALCLHDV